MAAFIQVKNKLLVATLQSVDEGMSSVVECDASDVAILDVPLC